MESFFRSIVSIFFVGGFLYLVLAVIVFSVVVLAFLATAALVFILLENGFSFLELDTHPAANSVIMITTIGVPFFIYWRLVRLMGSFSEAKLPMIGVGLLAAGLFVWVGDDSFPDSMRGFFPEIKRQPTVLKDRMLFYDSAVDGVTEKLPTDLRGFVSDVSVALPAVPNDVKVDYTDQFYSAQNKVAVQHAAGSSAGDQSPPPATSALDFTAGCEPVLFEVVDLGPQPSKAVGEGVDLTTRALANFVPIESMWPVSIAIGFAGAIFNLGDAERRYLVSGRGCYGLISKKVIVSKTPPTSY